MRKVIVGAFVSLDSVMQAPGGPDEDKSGGFKYGGWVAGLADEVFGEEVDKLFSQRFDLLLGRTTYDIFASFWPHAEGGPNDAIAKPFNAATKYVATRKGGDLSWKKSVALNDAARDVRKLKQGDGPALITQGSTNLIQTLLANDLVDEMKLFIFPILLGRGKKLFHDDAAAGAFKLSESRVSPNGIVIGRYVRDGSVKIGDFNADPLEHQKV